MNALQLFEHQTTGPLPVGFEFELFGIRYTWFDVSWDGFLMFGKVPLPALPVPAGSRFLPLNEELNNFLALGWNDRWPLGPREIAYEVREAAQRRRLVLSITAVQRHAGAGGPPTATQLVFYERTGMIDVHSTRYEPVSDRMSRGAARFTQTWVERRYRQLDTLGLGRILGS